jgi:hypothetical protein
LHAKNDDGARCILEPKQDAPIADAETPLVVRSSELAPVALWGITDESIERVEDAETDLGVKPTDVSLRLRGELVVPARGHESRARFASSDRRPPSRRYSCHASSAA